MQPTERPLRFLLRLARNTLVYLKNFIRDPGVASVMPSSPFLVQRMLGKMDLAGNCVVVEYGPAAGVFSRSILQQMGPEGRLVLIETNDDFVRRLRQQFGSDPRVTIFHQQAQDVSRLLGEAGEESADYVLSGIPFSFLPDPVQRELVDATHEALRPGGTFLVYQFRDHMGALLRPRFARVEEDFEPLNLPQMHVHAAVRE